MAQEIEKKYLLAKDGTSFASPELLQGFSSLQGLEAYVRQVGRPLRQGYLPLETGERLAHHLGMSIDFTMSEARLREQGEKLTFTVKGKGGLSRNEEERTIDRAVFDEYWEGTAGKRVAKIRLGIPWRGHTAEIDLYTDRNLMIAEVEVPDVAAAASILPLGLDVTDDPVYKNKNLAR